MKRALLLFFSLTVLLHAFSQQPYFGPFFLYTSEKPKLDKTSNLIEKLHDVPLFVFIGEKPENDILEITLYSYSEEKLHELSSIVFESGKAKVDVSNVGISVSNDENSIFVSFLENIQIISNPESIYYEMFWSNEALSMLAALGGTIPRPREYTENYKDAAKMIEAWAKRANDRIHSKENFEKKIEQAYQCIDNNNVSFDSLYILVTECYKITELMRDQEKTIALQRVDFLYSYLKKVSPIGPYWSSIILFRRSTIQEILDPTLEKGLPLVQELISVLEGSTTELGESTKNFLLKYAYLYCTSYSLKTKDDTETAKLWAKKVLKIDPDQTTAKAVLDLE